MENSSVLITGGTGFLGSHLARRLVSAGRKVAIIARKNSDTRRITPVLDKIRLFNSDEISFEQIIAESETHTVFHCATDYGRKKNKPSSLVDSNLVFPLRLLELCHVNGVKTFVNTDTALHKDTNNYSRSKKQFREWLRSFSNELCCINLELEHFYGPFDDSSKFVSFVATKFLSGAPSIELTEGKQVRDFTFIDDVVEACVKVLEHHSDAKTGFYNYEIASDEGVAIRDLVVMIRELSGNTSTEINFGAIPYRENELMKSAADTSAIRQLGWTPKYSLTDGLRKMIETEKNA